VNNNADIDHKATSSEPAAKPTPKNRLKRKTSAAESCVRIDLMRLCPNQGKALALERLFENYRLASVEIAKSFRSRATLRV